MGLDLDDSWAKKKDWQRATFPHICAVSSPLRPLTVVFGMGTGVTSSLKSPVQRMDDCIGKKSG
jgi:hypothetical protein